MNRGGVLLYLQSSLAQLAVAAKLPATTDAPNGWGGVLDQTLRTLGVAEVDLPNPVTDYAPVGDVLALARYYGLEALLTHLATAVDIAFDAPAMAKKRSQLFKQVTELLDRALTDITRRGYGPALYRSGTLNIDYIEPINPEFGMEWWS